MTLGLLLPQLLFWAIILSATLTRAQQTQQAGNDFVNSTTCYDGLAQADANGDNRVERDEYLTFVQNIGPPGFLADIDSMLDAPLTLQGSFLTLACICNQNGGDAQCCIGDNAHIPIDGVNIPDPSTFAFLLFVCSLTFRSIDLVLEEPSTSSISTSPTTSPTISLAPSPLHSNSSVLTPTATPTTQEPTTQSPSSSPSAIPTTSPHPTTSPSASLPSSSPSAIPTTSPSPTTSPFPPQPSSMHVGEGIGVGVTTIYTVAIVNGITENIPESSYVPDLIASMNVVAVEVASEAAFGSSNGSSRRRLEVRVSLPTFIDRVVDGGGFTDTPEFVDGVFELGACPSDLANPDNDKCEQVAASIGLFLDDEAPQVARQLYQAALHQAIVQGRLQNALVEINPDSPARILTGKSPGTNGCNSFHYTAGVVIGAVAVALLVLMVALFITRKRLGKPAFDELQPVSSILFGKEFEPDSAATEELDSAEKQRTDEEAGTAQSGEAILGATKAYYGQSSSDADWSRADGVEEYIEGRRRASSTASAGQSDRPSIYMSSLDSGSVYAEDELDPSTFEDTITFVADTISTELDNAKPGFDILQPVSLIPSGVEFELDSTAKVEQGSAGKQRTDEEAGTVRSGEAILGATKTEYGQNYQSSSIGNQYYRQSLSPASSPSSAGRSGWSSNSISSIDSGSEHTDELDTTTIGTMMLDLDNDRTEVNTLILAAGDRAGSRATVGATSALLAANASGRCDHESSFSSNHSSIETGDSSLEVRLDEQRAAGLDRLIEGGDWEGIIRAAKIFSSDDKSLAGSVVSHQDSQGSTYGAVLVDEPTKAAELRRLIQVRDWEGVRRAAKTFSSDNKSFTGSIVDSQGSASGAVQVDEQKAAELHRLIEGGDWEGIICAAETISSDNKSFAGSIVSHQNSQGYVSGAVQVDETSKAAELRRLIQVRDWEGVRRAASTFSSDEDKPFDESISSHQDSQGSASGAVQVDEPKAAELHRLIQVGDWEGALRPASTFSSDDKSFNGSIVSHQNSQGSASGAVQVDETKAAELRRLIQVRDWEGVRRAASTFSSDEDKSFDGSILSHQDSEGSTNSMSIEGSATSATRSAMSSGTSMNLGPAELRRQVEELLQQVAPEYMDKVDETLLRFKGREDEILKTLQTMQERQLSTRLELQQKSELQE